MIVEKLGRDQEWGTKECIDRRGNRARAMETKDENKWGQLSERLTVESEGEPED